MIRLQNGDRLPSVAGVQLLLNSHRAIEDAMPVDGDFGPITTEGVRAFQHLTRGLTPVGRVDPETWRVLARDQQLKVRDWADVTDPVVDHMVEVVREAGSRAIVQGGASFAVGNLAPAIAASGVGEGELFLLRFLGHGNRGSQAAGYGTGCHVFYETMRAVCFPGYDRCAQDRPTATGHERESVGRAVRYSGLSDASLLDPLVADAVRALRPLFAPFGSIEFHGCRVGGGREGATFLRRMADLTGVPCTAAHRRQRTGNAVRFAGPLRIVCSGGVTLGQWARARRPLAGSRLREFA